MLRTGLLILLYVAAGHTQQINTDGKLWRPVVSYAHVFNRNASTDVLRQTIPVHKYVSVYTGQGFGKDLSVLQLGTTIHFRDNGNAAEYVNPAGVSNNVMLSLDVSDIKYRSRPGTNANLSLAYNTPRVTLLVLGHAGPGNVNAYETSVSFSPVMHFGYQPTGNARFSPIGGLSYLTLAPVFGFYEDSVFSWGIYLSKPIYFVNLSVGIDIPSKIENAFTTVEKKIYQAGVDVVLDKFWE